MEIKGSKKIFKKKRKILTLQKLASSYLILIGKNYKSKLTKLREKSITIEEKYNF